MFHSQKKKDVRVNNYKIFRYFCQYYFVVVYVSKYMCSSGFPLDKAVEYVKLRNPLLINDLNMQYYIQDRYHKVLHTGQSTSYRIGTTVTCM